MVEHRFDHVREHLQIGHACRGGSSKVVQHECHRLRHACPQYCGGPTIKRLAALAGVSTTYLKAALKANWTMRLAVMNGETSLVPNGKSIDPAETLTAHFSRCSPTEKLEAAREIGVDVIWSDLLEPLLK
jgi:hypothetical protein